MATPPDQDTIKAWPLVQPSVVHPAPVPTQALVGGATSTAGDRYTLLQMVTPAGVNTYFLTPEVAGKLGEMLTANARADSGIVLAGAGVLGGGGKLRG